MPNLHRLEVHCIDKAYFTQWHRLDIERSFIGQHKKDVLNQIPHWFGVCKNAQTWAARLALGEVAADSPPPAALGYELAWETLRRWLLNWCEVVEDGKSAVGVQKLGRAQSVADLIVLTEEEVLQDKLANALGRDVAGWEAWAAAGQSALARALGWWLGQREETGVVLCDWREAAPFYPLSDAWRGGVLSYQGPAVEVSALARYQTQLQPWLVAGKYSAARLLARIMRLLAVLAGEGVYCKVVGGAHQQLALVETARGPLLHYAALSPEGWVQSYHIVPPTLWHSHRTGAISQAVAGGDRQWAGQRVLLIDPCVEYVFCGFDEGNHA